MAMETGIKTLISFHLGSQIFAFDSLKVRNILPYEGNITKVPNTRDFILGVINLHGNIVPITDLRRIMNMENVEYSKETSIIVVSPEDKIETQFGIVVDVVKEVFEIAENKILPPAFKEAIGLIENFEGTIKDKDDYIHLIDLMHLVSQIERKN